MKEITTGRLVQDTKEDIKNLSFKITLKVDVIENIARRIVSLSETLKKEQIILDKMETERRKKFKELRKLEKKSNKEKAGKVLPAFL